MNNSTAFAVYVDWLAALNERDWGRFQGLLSEEAEFIFTHLLPGENATLRGRSRILESFRGWQARFARLEGEIVDSISEVDRSSVRLWWRGSTLSGRRVGFASCHWLTVESGLIVDMVDFFDEKGYLEQVGD